MRRLSLLLLLPFLLGLVSCQHPPRPADTGMLILISIDGFRWDYLDKYDAPTLRGLAVNGVHARRLNPVFPSRTFPNHYTLVTGLRPERHGIVNNWFYDPVQQANFVKSNTASAWWDQGEPVWITAEKQGVRTACFFWPGSEAEIQGHRPSRYQKFDQQLDSAGRVDGFLTWLDQPITERPRFGTVYLDVVDIAGHKYGPDAPEVADAVREADAAVARLLAGLEKLGLRDTTSLVIVSDHGMSPISPDRVIFVEDLMDASLVTVEATGPHGGVRPKPGVDVEALVASIRAKAPPQARVYGPHERPAHLHYSAANPRVPPILFVMEDGWCLQQKAGWPKLKAVFDRGNHGWDPTTTPNMGALFIASGPAFRRGVKIPEADNLDVYNLLCAVLGLTPAANEGSDALSRAILQH